MINVGDVAYNFSLPDYTNTVYTLKQFRGKRVVLYFYPKDDTIGCTQQACCYKKFYKEFLELDVALIGISIDSTESHAKFRNNFDLPFLLLSDSTKEVCEHYDVLKEKQMFGKKYIGVVRTTYIIDENGLVEKVYEKVNPREDAEMVLKYLKK